MRAMLVGVVLAMLVGTPLAAAPFQPCPLTTIGWALQFSGPITAVLYDTSSQLMYVVFNNTAASAFSNVAIGVMQAFSSAQTQAQVQQVYQSQLLPNYHPLLLAETNNCPLLFENGVYIWAR